MSLSPIASIVNASDCIMDKLLGYGVGVIAGVDVAVVVAVMLTVGVKVGVGVGFFSGFLMRRFKLIVSILF
jgi:hypothetical protein